MKAVIIKQFGDPEVLSVSNTVPKPQFQIDEYDKVIVKVKASALNRADILQRQGKYPPPPGESEILGLEMSGIVEQVGKHFQGKWNIGDKVCALLGGGGYAEYVKVPGNMLMKVDSSLSFEEAAAIPEAWLTAFQALYFLGEFDKRNDKRTVLIHCGGSGVATSAIQLIKFFGSQNKIIVTAGSEDKIKFCLALGADFGFNYKEVDFAEKVLEVTNKKGVDMLMDFVGASYWEQNIKCLGVDGIMTMQGFLGGSTLPSTNLAPILAKRLNIKGSTLRSRSHEYKEELTKKFMEVTNFPAGGKLKPIISKVFQMEEVVEAHKFMEANQNIGKIILKIG